LFTRYRVPDAVQQAPRSNPSHRKRNAVEAAKAGAEEAKLL
jgi:hypothetical protein